MSERNYYVLCDDNCRFEGMTKEQIYDAIAEATGMTPTPVDTAFITQIKEQNANVNLKFWKGTEAQYAALSSRDTNTVYVVVPNSSTPAKFSDTTQIEAFLSSIGAVTTLSHPSEDTVADPAQSSWKYIKFPNNQIIVSATVKLNEFSPSSGYAAQKTIYYPTALSLDNVVVQVRAQGYNLPAIASAYADISLQGDKRIKMAFEVDENTTFSPFITILGFGTLE